jgi:hypothetical protein
VLIGLVQSFLSKSFTYNKSPAIQWSLSINHFVVVYIASYCTNFMMEDNLDR